MKNSTIKEYRIIESISTKNQTIYASQYRTKKWWGWSDWHYLFCELGVEDRWHLSKDYCETQIKLKIERDNYKTKYHNFQLKN